jgi:hypothetical protein
MLFNQRIIHKDNATLVDVSKQLNDLFADNATLGIVAAEDKLFIGSDLPFNHRMLHVTTANDLTAAVSEVAIWTGNAWTAAVDVMDETSSSGCTLARSGFLQWTTPKNVGWAKQDTEDMTGSGLETLRIYDLYWVRVTFSADLKATTALGYVGHRFADDSDLGGRYPDLVRSEVLAAFTTGKTSWTEQHFAAAEEIIRAVRKKKAVWSPNQLVNWEQFNLAAVHKVAEIIMTAFGADYADRRARAHEDYLEALDVVVVADTNEDGRVDEVERRGGWNVGLYRT